MGGSNNGSQVISLPQGGGALHGIGEKFSPDLHTGTGNFTIPIALPAGRNGFQPQLNLVYSTGTGNGPFGLGWNLSVPGVSRKTSEGIPFYDDSKDVFILSGAEDLVAIPGGPSGAMRYRPRTEGLFARIEHYRDARDDYWEVRSKDGLVSTYGTSSAAGQDHAVVSNPANRSHVFAWKLARTMDPFGNLIEYSYERETEQVDGPHYWDQVYLSSIRYADFGDPGNPSFLVTVAFTYEDRPDPFSEYRAGFEIRTIKRCRQIEVFTHPETDTLVRTYHLHYLDEGGPSSDRLPLNGISLLDQISVEGHDGTKSESFPPLEFGYTRFEPTKRSFQVVTGSEMPSASLANPDYELVDLMGSGLPDILETNGAVRYWRNRGNGQFDLPRQMNAAPAGIRLSDKGVQLIDADGDGRTDLLVSTETINGYYPSRFGAVWDSRSFHPYRKAPSFDLKDAEVRLVDLDGDGVTDAIRSGSRLECFFNDPKQGWNGSRFVERLALEVFPNVSFSDPRVKWADMTGDGLQDIALVHDGLVEYWPSLGRGDWGKRILMRNSPRFPEGYDPKRILLGDVDGDGVADLVYVEDTKVTLWINQSGNRWSDPITIHGTPPVSDTDALRLTDLLGNGVGGVMWSAEANGLSQANMFFLDFTGGTKPYVLNEMDNHMGALTRVAYAPSTRFYLEDEKRPETRWKTPLPFPVQVVAQVELIDSISQGKLTTEYRYHHGYWDGAEREFRGFGRTDQRDTELFTDYHSAGLHPSDRSFNAVESEHFSPPTETRTWFHQGPIGDEFGDWAETDFSPEYWSSDLQILSRPASVANLLKALPRRARRDALRTLRGHILRTELYALDGSLLEGRPYTVTEHLFSIREESPPVSDEQSRLHIFFPHPLAERTTQWERGEEPMTSFKFTGDYDEYGQPRSQISIAVPRGSDFNVTSAPGEPYLVTHTTTEYAQRDDGRVYITDRVARTASFEIINDGSPSVFDLRDSIEKDAVNARIIGQTINFYDGPAFEGLPFVAANRGQIGDYGAVVRTESLVLTEDILRDACKDGGAFVVPPYLEINGSPAWTAEYPQEFQALLPVGQGLDPTRPGLAITPVGYGFASGGANSPFARGYFAASERRRYDFHGSPGGGGRGTVTAKRDALGHDVEIDYDSYHLLPTTVTDAVGLRTQADYDYRVLQPRQVTDPNENRTVYGFTPLGLLESKAVMGKVGEAVGDTEKTPSTQLVYDLLAFADGERPISVRTIRRVHHVGETDVPSPQRDETIESLEYSDGFGRLLQTRSQAEDNAFGDPIFGEIGLASDQSLPVGDAVGRQRAKTDPPRVVVSGWQVYDNKGRVVEKYEPFFSSGWDVQRPNDAESGQKLTMYYDPRGHLIRTVNPDASEQRVIYGVPSDLTNPDQFTPTPWEAYTYDANDNAGRTHFTDGRVLQYSHHWNTPSNVVIDALGRTIQNVDRNRKILTDGSFSAVEELRIQSSYDIRGNLLSVADQLNRVTFRHVYDLSNRQWRVENLDAGIRRMALDAAGNGVEQRSSKGGVICHSYDLLNRPLRLWARDDGGSSIALRERLEYGDGSDPGQAANLRDASRQANLLGRPVRHYDEAGLLAFPSYDFKGNLLEKARQVISDVQILSVFAQAAGNNWQVPAYRVDWQPPEGPTLENYAAGLLDATAYQSSTTYDALNRVKSARYPQDVEGTRKELRPSYNAAGALEAIELDTATYVDRIVYNAKGQQTLIAYGNGVMTRHAYDVKTFRLARTRTERFSTPTPFTYHTTGEPLQDYVYAYDLVGNILTITDRTPGCGVLNNPDSLQIADPILAQLVVAGDALVRRFEYDPLYRLLSATGRECKDIPNPRPWTDDPRCGFNSSNHGTLNQDNAPNLTSIYREEYDYDPAGNMLLLRHSIRNAAWTRSFGMGGLAPAQWNQQWPTHLNTGGEWLAPPGNRFTHVGDIDSNGAQTHFFDENGNLIRERATRHFEWDHGDRLRIYRTQLDGSEPSVHAHYLYDSAGQRVKKFVRKQGGQCSVTVYIDGVFEYQEEVKGGGALQENTLHVRDNQRCVVLVRTGRVFPDDPSPAVRYQLGDHLGSINIVTDAGGGWINREEFSPYGETSFGSFARKRYRFTGKERDEESALNYHGARYYAPWICRWVSHDPLDKPDDVNNAGRFEPYSYVQNKPLVAVDPDGRNPVIWILVALGGLVWSESPANAPGRTDRPTQSRTSYTETAWKTATLGVGAEALLNAPAVISGAAKAARGIATVAKEIATVIAAYEAYKGYRYLKHLPLSDKALIQRAGEIHRAIVTAELAKKGIPLKDLEKAIGRSKGWGTIAITQFEIEGQTRRIVTTNNPNLYRQLKQDPLLLNEGEILGKPPTRVYGGSPIHAEQTGVQEAIEMGAKGGTVATSNSGCEALCVSLLREEFPTFRHVNPAEPKK